VSSTVRAAGGDASVVLAPERGARSPSPWLSIQAPAPASPRSITSTTKIRPHGRRAGIGSESDESSTICAWGRGCDGRDSSRTGVATAYESGATLLARGTLDGAPIGRAAAPWAEIGAETGAALADIGAEVGAAAAARGFGAFRGTNGVAGTGRGGITPGAVTGAADPAAGASWRGGNGASSEIFWVGATRWSELVKRAPQPPQNRESCALLVPQLGQRIA
jgi:hypothetical protein